MGKETIYKHIWSVTNDYIYSKSSSASKANVIVNYFKALSLEELKSIGTELNRNQNASHKIPFKYLLDLARKAYSEKINAEKIIALDLNIDVTEDRSANADENLKNSVDGSNADSLDQNANFAFVNTYNIISNHENNTNTIGVPQNQISAPIVPQILCEEEFIVPQNEMLFGVNNSLYVPQIDIDKIIDAFVPQKKQAMVHKCILDLNISDEKIKNKMIAFMRYVYRMIDAIDEKLYGNRCVAYVEISSSAFDLIDEHNHHWIKEYLAQIGLKPKDHSYSVQNGKCIKYYIEDLQKISEMRIIDVDHKLQKEIKRFERKLLKRKIPKMNAFEKMALVGNAFLAGYLPPLTIVEEKKPLEGDGIQNNIDVYEHMLKFGIGVPSMGYWHRCYSNAQNLAKWIRALTGLVEVDSKAMQPNLLLFLAYKDGKISEEQYHRLSGDVYTNLAPHKPRSSMKDQMTKVYLSNTIDMMKGTDIYQIFKDSGLGNLNGYAEDYKLDDYTNLSRRLTQLEATLIFTAMSKAWQQGVECFYLYDALLVLPENAYKMKEIMDGVFAKFGVRTWAEVKQAA